MTEELKEKLRQAKSEEEAKQIIENHKSELSDEDLEAIAGAGVGIDTKNPYSYGPMCIFTYIHCR